MMLCTSQVKLIAGSVSELRMIIVASIWYSMIGDRCWYLGLAALDN